MNGIFRNIFVQIGIGLVILIALIWGSIALLSRHAPDYSSTTVSRMDLAETVTATGDVAADQDVTLAFNMQGKVNAVYADVGSTTSAGEVLAILDTGSLQASMSGAQADVEAAQANLATAQGGARPQELALYQQKYDDASSALIVAMKDAYLEAEDAVTVKADSLFANGNSSIPTIDVRTQSQIETLSINAERASVGSTLTAWGNALAPFGAQATDTAALSQARTVTSNALLAVKSYLDDLNTIASALSVGNSGLSQQTINTYVAAVNAAGQEVTGATTAEQAADAAWSAARDSLTLEQAGSTSEDIQAAQAAVDKAQAAVAGLQSQLDQSSIVSPFAGIVTAMNVKVGEVYVPGISADEGIELISAGDYKIEAYVPETDIGKIQQGDPVAVTFDAYGPAAPFAAHVALVDPAETTANGINAYKVTIAFDDPSDSRIKSGLTANAVITTRMAAQALSVPSRAIITRGTDTFVLVRQPASTAYAEQAVTTGITGADGYTQIVSGLNEGDTIASFGTGGQ